MLDVIAIYPPQGDEMKEKERRFTDKELRVQERDGKKLIAGYAAVFNSLSENLGGFRERIKPGAFRDAIGRSDTVALFNHDSNIVLGRVSSGTLTVREDENGLWMEIDPPDTSAARDLMTLIERGDISKQSFGFIVRSDEWAMEDGVETRTIIEVDELFDVSPVTYPAYPDTSVALRSLKIYKSTANGGDDNGAIAENEDILLYRNEV